VTAPLTIDDIADLRAYERERPQFLRHIVDLKARRRVSVGPMATFVFENRDTVRFQIQEMARAEKLISDQAIQTELDIYNTLLPGLRVLSATMFVELTSEAALREWRPKLFGVERSAMLELPAGEVVRSLPEADHAARLTDDELTPSVHYVRFELTAAQVDAFATGRVALAIVHPHYAARTPVPPATVAELIDDLRSA
jgi:Protein of unknown function (DUF3501)